jgi:hypothetical protein
MMSLGSNGCFVTGTPYLNRGHSYGFASSVGHLRLDSVGSDEFKKVAGGGHAPPPSISKKKKKN